MQAKLELGMQPRVSPQLVMAGTLLQLSGAEMEKAIYEEMIKNPALELAQSVNNDVQGIASRRTSASYRRLDGGENVPLVETIVDQPSAVDLLVADASLIVDRCDQGIAFHLLHSLDGHGYLRRSAAGLAAEIGASEATVTRVIRLLQQLEPPGIAARDLRECLTIQCAGMAATGADTGLAHRMLTECWDDFVNQQWRRIAHKLDATRDEIDQSRRAMKRHLTPYPLLLLGSAAPEEAGGSHVDLIISREANGNMFSLQLPGAAAFALRIDAAFAAAVRDKGGSGLAATEQAWISERINRARLFIAAIEQRWLTLRRIGDYLISYQHAFLEQGPAHLRALTRADVAAALNLHESTVSRAIRDKVVQLPNGHCAPLSEFFDNSLAAKEAIRQLLAHRNQSLSDLEIASQLQTDGLVLSRRTVNKYRRQLNIPSSHGRHVAVFAGLE